MGFIETTLSYLVAIVLLTAPIGLAVMSDRKVKRFQAEVFGQWVRMARRIRFMIWATFTYYIGVLIHGVATRGLTALIQFPWTVSAFALAGRIAIAIMVFALLFGISLAMQQVIRPSDPPHSTTDRTSGN